MTDPVFRASQTTELQRPRGNEWEAGDRSAFPLRAKPAWPAQASGPRAGTSCGTAAARLGGERVGVCVGGGRPNFLSRARAASGGSRKTLCVDRIRDRLTDGRLPGTERRFGSFAWFRGQGHGDKTNLEKARVNESPRRGLPDCTLREACLRTLGPFTRLL
ncbi:hypothetical protein J1605_019253 [Eschrichtius robustus]|uniref:Uncharacterized protein n=1 Tax=Eschrichtius robustus TaxID=9764 RepID=A0AB34HLS8_ESCRO|nr:hypothetical protein J1605_019253 [Eschrichtius robustus]